MLATNDRPYVVYATADIHDSPRWWIRQRDGQYADWDGEHVLSAARLMPVSQDYMWYVGDWQAISESYEARL